MTRQQFLDEVCKPWAIGMNEILAAMTDKERQEWVDRLVDAAKDTASSTQQVRTQAITKPTFGGFT